MISSRVPKGIYSRNTPDWFIDSLAWGGGEASFGSGENFVGLNNNDNAGRILYVYGLTASTTSVDGMHVENSNYQTIYPIANCVSAQPTSGAPPGQIVFGEITVPPTTGNFFNTLASAAPQLQMFADWPLFIVPVGYTLLVAGVTDACDVSAAFWYVYRGDHG